VVPYCKLEPIDAPEEAFDDDPALLIARAAAAYLPTQRPERLTVELEEALGWTSTQEALHPRWPEGTPGGLGGQFMRVGQRFLFDGKEWEISHILGGKVIANESSGKYQAAETREFDPAKTPGKAVELGGAQRPKARKIKGGGKEGDISDVTVVDPYVDHASHDPNLALPAESKMTAEQWKRYGRLEQMHYIDLMQRYGAHNASGASALIAKAYQDYEAEIQGIVDSAYSSQYGSSSGYSLSLTSIFKALTGQSEAQLEEVRRKREAAMELQGRIRDAYAWDLYNRTKSPDVALFHKDHAHGEHWWNQFIHKPQTVFSGLSQTHHYRPGSEAFGKNVLATPISIRHIVMATWSAGPLKGGKKNFTAEREVSIPFQFRVDDRSMVFSSDSISTSYQKWLAQTTTTPQGGAHLERFKEAVKGGEPLPIPPPPADIHLGGDAGVPPPPQEALDALAEHSESLPDVGKQVTPEQLKQTGLPFEHLDENGLPKKLTALDAGYEPGDFMMGLQGTLYWIGPNPNDPSGFGLMMHKLVPDGPGKLKPNGETFPFDNTHEDYKLLGNVKPPKPKEIEFDPEGWVFADEKPKPLSQFKPGDKFKVEGTAYEITGPGTASTTPVKVLDTGAAGTINSDYQAVPLTTKEGWVPEALKMVPAKGMSLAYDGKKHVVTSVSKTGVVSIRRSTGGKVIKLGPDDPALEGLFDHSAWEQGKPTQIGQLGIGEMFHGGRGEVLRPYRITTKDDKWVHWQNLDTGEEGKSLLKKKVRRLESAGGVGEEEKPKTPTAVTGPPKPYEAASSGDAVLLGEMKMGDAFTHDGEHWVVSDTSGNDPSTENPKTAVVPIKADGTYGVQTGMSTNTTVTLMGKGGTPEIIEPPEPKTYHGYPEGMEVEMVKKFGDKTWKGKVIGEGPPTSTGADTLKVQPEGAGKVYTVGLQKVLTPVPTPSDEGVSGPLPSSVKPGVKLTTATGDRFTVIGPSYDGDVLVGIDVKPHAGGPNLNLQVGIEVTMYPPDPEPEAVSPTDVTLDELSDVQQAADFTPYKSVYGTGGKYKHHKISELAEGIVFHGVHGPDYKVVKGGPTPIITDGKKNYTVDGDLRGRVDANAHVPDGPPLPSEEPPPNVSPKPGDKATVGVLKQGTYFTPDIGGTWKVTDENQTGNTIQAQNTQTLDSQAFSADQEVTVIEPTVPIGPAMTTPAKVSELPVGWLFKDGEQLWQITSKDPSGVHVVSYPEEGQTTAYFNDTEVLTTGTWTPEPPAAGLEIVDMLLAQDVGSKIDTPGGPVQVVAHTKNGDTVLKQTDTPLGLVYTVPSDTLLSEIEGPPEAEPEVPVGADLGDFVEGDTFIGASGLKFEVVTQTAADMTVVKNGATGELQSLNSSTDPTLVVQTVTAPDEGMEPAHSPTSELAAQVKATGATDHQLDGYKSDWGSGGKYKHEHVSEFNPGEKFRDKTGVHFVYVEAATGGKILVYRTSDGQGLLVDAATRVRRL
jgi:hypothetical protein